MEFKKIVTIDCGVSNGGIIIKNGDHIEAIKMPVITETTKKKTKLGRFKKKNSTDIAKISQICKENKDALFMIEKLTLFPRDTDNIGKRFMIQRMMSNYDSVLTSIKIFVPNFIEVSPRTWQTYLNLVVKGEEKEDRKKRYKRAAQDWYPDIAVFDWNADAFCLLQFAQRKLAHDKNFFRKK